LAEYVAVRSIHDCIPVRQQREADGSENKKEGLNANAVASRPQNGRHRIRTCDFYRVRIAL
jgi:hypothetical protein